MQRPRGRDLATGIVLGAGLGLAALFLYLDTTHHSTTGATVTILFGSIFTSRPTTILPLVLAFGAVALVTCSPLLPAAAAELAERRARRGARHPRAASSAPCTCSRWRSPVALCGDHDRHDPLDRAARRPRRHGAAADPPSRRGRSSLAAAIGLAATWLGILLAYDSYYWPPPEHGWPVSFFVVTLIFVFYLLAGLARRALRDPHGD